MLFAWAWSVEQVFAEYWFQCILHYVKDLDFLQENEAHLYGAFALDDNLML